MMQPSVLDWLPTVETPLLRAAEIYIEHGLRMCIVHGIVIVDGVAKCTCGAVPGACKPGKHPVIGAWQKKIYTSATDFRDALGSKRVPELINLGLVLGVQLDGRFLLAVDVDDFDRLKALEEVLGELPATLMSRSGGGGAHRIYALGAGQDPKRLRNRGGLRLTSEEPTVGVDVKCVAGQVVVCPSLHESGERYAWANALPIAELPQRWYDVIAEPIAPPRSVRSSSRGPASSNVTDLNTRYIEKAIENNAQDMAGRGKGERNQTLFSKTCTLLEYCAGASLDFDRVLGPMRDAGLACGLPRPEVDSVLRKAERTVRASGKTRVPPEPQPRASSSSGPSTAGSAAAEEEEEDLDAWRQLLVVDRGKYADCTANVISVLGGHPSWKGVLQYDMFREAVVFTKDPPCRSQDAPLHRPQGNAWVETDDTRTAAWILAHVGFEPSKGAVVDAVATVAERASVHPVRAYLESLVWDGEERLPTFLANYFGARPGLYTAGIGVCWMISCVARVMRPGVQVDYMIGLEGPQGLGKSSGLRALCPVPSWYSDTGVTIGQKDSYISLHGKWIFCFDELDSIRGSDVTKTKNFLTSTSDNFRPPWGRRNRDYPRQTCFAYTTNEGHYLRDRTGNRRWWPFACSRIDREAIARDRDQLWAEAKARFERGEAWWPGRELEALCRHEQAERQIDDPWTGIVDNWLDSDGAKRLISATDGGLLTHDVLLSAIGKPARDIQRGDEMRIAEVLKELGWAPGKQVSEGGRRVRRYVRL